MKKSLRVLLLFCTMLLLAVMPAIAEETDAVSSASVAELYGDSGLTGDDLMDAFNYLSGFYIVSTTNPDGTPNSAFFIYSMLKNEDTYYLQMGLAENQSKQNLLTNGEGLAIYAATPSSEEDAKPYAVSGARMWFKQVTDEELLKTLNTSNSETALFFEVTEIRPLG